MRAKLSLGAAVVLSSVVSLRALGEEAPLPQPWDYAAKMRTVAARFQGRPGVVLHVGDSITYASPYGQWARSGRGKTAEDRAVLAWMHAGADDETDGWWLARFDHPAGGRSHTACGGLRADELIAGGKNGLPALEVMLRMYRPQIVVLMIGTNDAAAGRDPSAYRRDVETAVDLMLGQGTIGILSTIPPYFGRLELSSAYNRELRSVARERSLPLIDFEREILTRRPDDWNGTLLVKNDAHPTASLGSGSASPVSEPTAENLRRSGYLLRGWLSVRKIAEVHRAVVEAPPLRAEVVAPPQAAEGQERRLPVTRDTWFSDVGSEAEANLGGAPRLKLKSYQEFSLIDVETQALRGRVVRKAVLHARSVGSSRLRRVTVGSLGASWVEGTSPSYAPQPGSSSYRQRRNPDVPWTIPGSDLTSVILGQGGTSWRMADATEPDAQGWQDVVVDPSIVAARVAGISEGFLVFDDTGSEWTRQGEKFTLENFPNRFVFSRESGPASAPYLTVVLGDEDRRPPAEPLDVAATAGSLPAGEAWVSWSTPADEGAAGTVGFFVTLDGQDVPRYLIPLASRVGEPVRMHLRDLGVPAGATVSLAIRAVDGAGNVGKAATARVRVSDRSPRPLPDVPPGRIAAAPTPLPRLGGAEVAVIDELDKVQPVTGAMIPSQPEGYLAANHLWDARSRQIRLQAARNEFVGFQVLVRGPLREVRPTLVLEGLGIGTEFGRYHPVPSRKGPMPDPIVPLDFALEGPAEGPPPRSMSFHGDLYVPHDAAAGEHRGKLTLRSGDETLTLDVSLRVWDFTLPDELSFLPDMNCYGIPPRDERHFYRLAHAHRTVLNKVPYSQAGIVESGCAPAWDGRRLDWTAWDRRFGAYFDGSAFADLPRKGVPIESFFLPLHENWPDTMEGHYNGDYWADRAFPPSYRRDFVEVSRQMAEHFHEKGWKGTLFQCFFNGKNNYKARGWSRGSSPWLLDEPAHWQDFWALRYYGAAFHEGVRQTSGPAKLVFRADISRPEWQRDSLDGLLDYNVVGGAFRPYRRIVLDRKEAQGQLVVEYGGSNAIEDANVQPLGWSLDSWSLGSDGVLPWQTVGRAGSWRQADTLALFYPTPGGGAPVPSIRLKAFRRGQQDVEYLTLYAQVTGQPRWAVGQSIREALHLAGERRGSGLGGGEDAGLVQYARLLPQDVWTLRHRIGTALSAAHPQPRRRLVELRTPPRDPAHLETRYAADAGPRPPALPAEPGRP